MSLEGQARRVRRAWVVLVGRVLQVMERQVARLIPALRDPM